MVRTEAGKLANREEAEKSEGIGRATAGTEW